MYKLLEDRKLAFRKFLFKSCPTTIICPEEGSKSPVIIRKVVVFPAPFTPNKPKHSDGRIAKDRRSTAGFLFCLHRGLIDP